MSRWSAGWRTRRFVRRAVELLEPSVPVSDSDGGLFVCWVDGVGVGSGVTFVFRVSDESLDRPGSLYG